MDVVTVSVVITAAVVMSPVDVAAMNAALDLEALRLTELHGLPEGLLQAVMWLESRGDAWALGTSGDFGPMQVVPATARGIAGLAGFDGELILSDPMVNLRAGAWLLASLLARFDGDPALALAAYNGGLGAVLECNCVPEHLSGYVGGVYWTWNRPYVWEPPPTAEPRVPGVAFDMMCYSSQPGFREACPLVGALPELAGLPAVPQSAPLVNVEGHGSQAAVWW